MNKFLIGLGIVLVVVMAGMTWQMFYSGSKCDFRKCPETSSLFKTYIDTNQNIQFEYMDSFFTQYVTPQEWPPKVEVRPGFFSCAEGGDGASHSPQTHLKMINGATYCVTTQNEGAAGSVYTSYQYEFPKENKLVTLSFVLRFPQCANYDNPQKTACENERAIFDVDALADRMAQSLKAAGR